MAISAANAPDDNKDAAPAAIRILTLRIGFVLLSGEADEASHQKLTAGRCHQILKRHLTLIIKVDNPRRFFQAGVPMMANAPQSLTANVPSPRVACHLRQEHREQAEGGKKGADLIDEGDAHLVGDAAEHRGAEAADAEGDAEEHPGN